MSPTVVDINCVHFWGTCTWLFIFYATQTHILLHCISEAKVVLFTPLHLSDSYFSNDSCSFPFWPDELMLNICDKTKKPLGIAGKLACINKKLETSCFSDFFPDTWISRTAMIHTRRFYRKFHSSKGPLIWSNDAACLNTERAPHMRNWIMKMFIFLIVKWLHFSDNVFNYVLQFDV